MKTIEIGSFVLGPGHPCFMVAEIGINHNGDMDLAKKTIDAAIEAGANSVKFQNYYTEDFISDRSLTYEYISQGQTVVESQFDMFKRCELSLEQLSDLNQYCQERNTVFHSTPTSLKGLQALLDLEVPLLKNGSDFLTHLPFIEAMGKTGLPTVLSTGMATLADMDEAVRTFRQTGNPNLILLHCISSYPTPPEAVNLKKIPALASAFECLVGFSDHTEGCVAALGAVVYGACFIEKHFTLDKNLSGPDHRFSADPTEFAQLVSQVRNMEQCLGSSALGFSEAEAVGHREYRLSCVASKAFESGHILSEEDLIFRRPGHGFPPKLAHIVKGRTLKRAVEVGHVFTNEDFQ